MVELIKTYTLKRLNISFLLLVLFTKCLYGQKLTAEIGSEKGIYIIHYGQNPTFQYDTVTTIHKGGGIDKGWKSSRMIDKMLKKMLKKRIDGDAIMFISENMTDAIVIKFRDEKLKNPVVELEKIGDIYLIYLEQNPLFDLKFISTIESSKIIKNWRTKTLRKMMLNRAISESIKFNILYFKEDDLWQADLYLTN